MQSVLLEILVQTVSASHPGVPSPPSTLSFLRTPGSIGIVLDLQAELLQTAWKVLPGSISVSLIKRLEHPILHLFIPLLPFANPLCYSRNTPGSCCPGAWGLGPGYSSLRCLSSHIHPGFTLSPSSPQHHLRKKTKLPTHVEQPSAPSSGPPVLPGSELQNLQ